MGRSSRCASGRSPVQPGTSIPIPGGAHYYGTKRGRAALVDGLRAADSIFHRSRARWAAGHPPIHYICVTAPLSAGASLVEAWEGTTPDGVRLSDHSGLVVELRSSC